MDWSPKATNLWGRLRFYDETAVRGASRGHSYAEDIGQIFEIFAEVVTPEIWDGGHELDHLVRGLERARLMLCFSHFNLDKEPR